MLLFLFMVCYYGCLRLCYFNCDESCCRVVLGFFFGLRKLKEDGLIFFIIKVFCFLECRLFNCFYYCYYDCCL